MKQIILILIGIIAFHKSLAQNKIAATIIDEKTEELLPFCHILNKNKQLGTVSNEEGYFEISCAPNDTLLFSYLGYKAKYLPFEYFQKNKTVLLQPDVEVLSEVTVMGMKEDRMIELIHQARQYLLNNKDTYTSKAYMFVNTISEKKPIEVSEYFYNASVKYGELENITFKNGQSYLSETKHGKYFLNLNISQALILYSLTQGGEYFPTNPLELPKSQLRKKFNLSLVSKTSKYVQIAFSPRKENPDFFSGQVWIDPRDFSILKIQFENATDSKSLFTGMGDTKINTLNFNLTYAYNAISENNKPLSYIKVSYAAELSDTLSRDFDIETEAIIHLYDYQQHFINPKIEFPDFLSDYRMLTVSEDPRLWEALINQNIIKQTSKQQLALSTIKNKGKRFSSDLAIEDNIFENIYYEKWSSEKRIRLENKKDASRLNRARNDRNLRLNTILYLNVVKKGQDFIFETSSIFDFLTSFNNLAVDPYAAIYQNIYFDLTEIHRRKLDAELSKPSTQFEDIEGIYNSIHKQLLEAQQKLKSEAFAGRNKKKLKKWNIQVYEALQVDNFQLFDIE